MVIAEEMKDEKLPVSEVSNRGEEEEPRTEERSQDEEEEDESDPVDEPMDRGIGMQSSPGAVV